MPFGNKTYQNLNTLFFCMSTISCRIQIRKVVVRHCLKMAATDSIRVVDDDYVKRIHSRTTSGHLHKGNQLYTTLTCMHE